MGVEPGVSIESTQLIDSGNTRIGMIFTIAKSTVRHFPERPNLHLPTAPFGEERLEVWDRRIRRHRSDRAAL